MNDKYWRYLANFWTVAVMGAVLYDFIYDNALGEFISPLLVLYIAILTIFAGAKEFERWHHLHQSRHPGEYFVLAWTLLIAGILLADFLLKKTYRMPAEVISTYITVLGILAITQKSKSFFRKKRS